MAALPPPPSAGPRLDALLRHLSLAPPAAAAGAAGFGERDIDPALRQAGFALSPHHPMSKYEELHASARTAEERVRSRLRQGNKGLIAPTIAEVARLGLEENLRELDDVGFTVVPPGKVFDDPGFIAALRKVVDEVAVERRFLDPTTGELTKEAQRKGGEGLILFHLLHESPLFEKALMCPALVALVTYLMGGGALLSSSTSKLKVKGKDQVPMHADAQVPTIAWFSANSTTACNTVLCLTDYSRENGSIAFVPGSHKLAAHPGAGVGPNAAPGKVLVPTTMQPKAVPMKCAAGSLIVWHGNCWHGAYDRLSDGMRQDLTMPFVQSWMTTQEEYRVTTTQAMLERNGPRFAAFTGQLTHYGWGPEGLDYRPGEKAAYYRRKYGNQPDARNPGLTVKDRQLYYKGGA